jgi:hypothetical protein
MSQNKRVVHIVNPTSGPGWTSNRRAVQYVRDGRARFVPGGIEFIVGNLRHLAVVRMAEENEYDRAAHSGFAPLEALRNLPMVGHPELMLTVRSRKTA